jgi:N-acetylneuraminic acid mutarotase
MGRVMLESPAGRLSVRTVLAATALVPATLLLFGLGASGMAPPAAIESGEQGPRQDERPVTRSYHGAAVVDGRIYLIGGAGEDNKPFGSVQVYDPATGAWAARANMPTARALFGTAAVGTTIYAVGGTTIGRDKLAVVEAYDTLTDTWTRKADMPTPRNALSTAVVDGKVYAIGGWGYDRPEGGWEAIDPNLTGQDFSTVEAYDPKTDTWETRAAMPTPRSHMTVSALGGKIYAIDGAARIVAGRSAEYRPVLEVYDTATNRWTRVADPPTPRSVPSSGVVDGRIYVMGGAFHRGPTASTEDVMRTLRTLSLVEIYDPASGRWSRGADLATARGWFSTGVVNGKVYVVGGRSLAPDSGTPGASVTFPGMEVYTPTTR